MFEYQVIVQMSVEIRWLSCSFIFGVVRCDNALWRSVVEEMMNALLWICGMYFGSESRYNPRGSIEDSSRQKPAWELWFSEDMAAADMWAVSRMSDAVCHFY